MKTLRLVVFIVVLIVTNVVTLETSTQIQTETSTPFTTTVINKTYPTYPTRYDGNPLIVNGKSYFINTLRREQNLNINCPEGQRKDQYGICREQV